MSNASIFKSQKLLTLDYYVEKISLAMQRDPIFMTQIKDCVSFLQMFNNAISGINEALMTLLYNVIASTNENIDVNIEPYQYSDMLEKVAAIFNIPRRITITFENLSAETAFIDFNSTVANDNLNTTFVLNDNQLRLLIYCTIMKSSYDGTKEMLEKVYATVINFIRADEGLKTSVGSKADSWKIYQVTHVVKNALDEYVFSPGEADCIFDFSGVDFATEDAPENNYFTLFFAGLLTIQSAGIKYYQASIDTKHTLLWAYDDNIDPSAQNTDQMKWYDQSADILNKWL